MNSRKNIWLLLLLLAGATLACRLTQPNPVEIPQETIPVTTEAVEDLREEVRQAEEQMAASGQAEIQITEAQLTSFVAFQLLEQGITDFNEPQVYLRSGQILISGRYQDNLSITAAISPTVNEGNLQLQLVSVRLGPVAAPDSIVQRVQTMLDQQVGPALQKWLNANFEIQSITIADGVMTLSGAKP